MFNFSVHRSCIAFITFCIAGLAALPVAGHEAWLLTQSEIEALAKEPVPDMFTSRMVLSLAAAIGCAVTCMALFLEDYLRWMEDRIEPFAARAMHLTGPIALRLGLAVMLGLAATGGLPRHGTEIWTQPTFLVPDMQLSVVPAWSWLALAQIVLAICLLSGFLTRLSGVLLIFLSGLGLFIFGFGFLAYAPHFAAPGILMIVIGSGPISLDRFLGIENIGSLSAQVQTYFWRAAQILFGAGFVYLAVAYKLTQPTLLIAIFKHGDMPTFGLSYPLLALIMTGVEIICGALLVVGRLIRPVALAIIGAITFLAVILGETPLFHANLYGTMFLIGLVGNRLGVARHKTTDTNEALA